MAPASRTLLTNPINVYYGIPELLSMREYEKLKAVIQERRMRR